jgi:UDP-3-O-[3-hydroxymyristoyl] glucosamine N-acyltransferase
MQFTALEIAKHVGGEVVGDNTAILKNFAPIECAQVGDLTFAENEAYFARAEENFDSRVKCAHRIRQSACIVFPRTKIRCWHSSDRRHRIARAN